MATSGTTAFTLDVNQICEEAFERCGVDKQKLAGDSQQSARRSLNLMFTAWSNVGSMPWRTEKASLTLTAGTASYTLPAGTIDVVTAVLRRDGIDIDMTALARSDYESIPSKTTTGRPDRYFIDKQATPVMYLWQVPENSTDTIEYWALKPVEDVTTAIENVDAPNRWLDAICWELAYRMFMKLPTALWSMERLAEIKNERKSSYDLARMEDGDRADMVVLPWGLGW